MNVVNCCGWLRDRWPWCGVEKAILTWGWVSVVGVRRVAFGSSLAPLFVTIFCFCSSNSVFCLYERSTFAYYISIILRKFFLNFVFIKCVIFEKVTFLCMCSDLILKATLYLHKCHNLRFWADGISLLGYWANYHEQIVSTSSHPDASLIKSTIRKRGSLLKAAM